MSRGPWLRWRKGPPKKRMPRICNCRASRLYAECRVLGSPRSEHERRAAERAEAKHLLYLRRKPIVATAEVDRTRRDVNLQFRASDDHRDARTARITRDNCFSSIAASVRTTTSPIAISSLTAGT